MLIQDTLESLAKLPFKVTEDSSIIDVTNVMLENKNGFVVFVKEDKVTGILTERDLLKYINFNQDYDELAFKYATKNVISFKGNRNIEYVLVTLLEHDIRRAVVVDKDDNYIGVTTHEHLVHYIDNDIYKVKMKLQNLDNLHDLHSVDYETTIKDTLIKMEEDNMGSMVVTQNDKPVGILTERDIIKLINGNIDINQKTHHVMSTPIIFVDIEQSIESTLKKMKEEEIQRIVVKDGNSFKLLGIRDILQSVKGNYYSLIEKKLQYSKGILNSISEAIIEIIEVEEEYIIGWCNQKAIDIFERSILDMNIEKLLEKNIWDNIKNKIINEESNFKYKFHKNDSVYQITCICDRSTEYNIRLVFIDITELEKMNTTLQQKVDEKTQTLQIMNQLLEEDMKKGLEENRKILSKLHEKEKLASMGEMIGNIAHHWRQPLSVISSSSTGIILHHDLGTLDKTDLVKTCNLINDNAQFLSKTISDFSKFLNFNEEKTLIKIDTMIDEAINQNQTFLDESKVKIIKDIEAIEIETYKTDMTQTFINIIKNSCDNFIAHNTQDAYIFIECFTKNNKLLINFTDTGGGIDETYIDKVFDPYFTTKHKSKGTGLGLTMMYNFIVNSMRGNVSISNKVFTHKERKYKGVILSIELEK